MPDNDAYPFAITDGSDGNLWFTESAGHKIGKISPQTGDITEYNVAGAGITVGHDDFMWFTQADGVDKINPLTGAITDYNVGN
jgi:virginiamycin B lyase